MCEEYANELSKLAVSKASVAIGFKLAQTEVVECLGDVLRHYIEGIAQNAQSSVETYGRTNPGVMDIFPVLEQSVIILIILVFLFIQSGFDCRNLELRGEIFKTLL